MKMQIKDSDGNIVEDKNIKVTQNHKLVLKFNNNQFFRVFMDAGGRENLINAIKEDKVIVLPDHVNIFVLNIED
jgi:hypothetical protein